jgi:hypothetical protein
MKGTTVALILGGLAIVGVGAYFLLRPPVTAGAAPMPQQSGGHMNDSNNGAAWLTAAVGAATSVANTTANIIDQFN